MNIFILDEDPLTAARYHHDRHVVKMILETAQLLSGVWHFLDSGREGLYKATHLNHPCAVWARASSPNYSWLYWLGKSLCEEYTHRYGKIHKTQAVMALLADRPHISLFPKIGFTPYARCMPNQYRKNKTTVEAYRAYYIGEKVQGNKWTNRETPSWIHKF
jgi:hypothetical protein